MPSVNAVLKTSLALPPIVAILAALAPAPMTLPKPTFSRADCATAFKDAAALALSLDTPASVRSKYWPPAI